MRQAIHADQAPAAIGSYSAAIKAGHTVYLSGQIPLNPQTMQLVDGDIRQQVEQVFLNIKNVAAAAGMTLDAVVKLTVYLMDLSHIAVVNEAIARHFSQPYPARTSIQVSALPKSAAVEIDAILMN